MIIADSYPTVLHEREPSEVVQQAAHRVRGMWHSNGHVLALTLAEPAPDAENWSNAPPSKVVEITLVRRHDDAWDALVNLGVTDGAGLSAQHTFAHTFDSLDRAKAEALARVVDMLARVEAGAAQRVEPPAPPVDVEPTDWTGWTARVFFIAPRDSRARDFYFAAKEALEAAYPGITAEVCQRPSRSGNRVLPVVVTDPLGRWRPFSDRGNAALAEVTL